MVFTRASTMRSFGFGLEVTRTCVIVQFKDENLSAGTYIYSWQE